MLVKTSFHYAASTLIATLAVALAFALVTSGIFTVSGIVSGTGVSFHWRQLAFFTFWVAVFTTVITLVIGIPVFVAMRRLSILRLRYLALAGFSVAAGIFLLVDALVRSGRNYSHSQHYFGAFRAIVVDGQRTLWGWINILENALVFGLCGLLGAVVFGMAMARFRTFRAGLTNN